MEAVTIWIVIPVTRWLRRRQQLRYLISQCNTWSLHLFCKFMMVLTLQRLLYARTCHIFRFMLTILLALPSFDEIKERRSNASRIDDRKNAIVWHRMYVPHLSWQTNVRDGGFQIDRRDMEEKIT